MNTKLILVSTSFIASVALSSAFAAGCREPEFFPESLSGVVQPTREGVQQLIGNLKKTHVGKIVAEKGLGEFRAITFRDAERRGARNIPSQYFPWFFSNAHLNSSYCDGATKLMNDIESGRAMAGIGNDPIEWLARDLVHRELYNVVPAFGMCRSPGPASRP